MAMTKFEQEAKEEVMDILGKQGYSTYAMLLNEFDLNLTEDPSVIGYMQPGKYRIVINRGITLKQVSVVVRHEILHEYLKHEIRLVRHLAKKKGWDPDKLDDISLEQIKKELYSNKKFNVAGDYEISNRGYTDADKREIRKIKLNGQILRGLVTEDDHSDWTDLSITEMYDLLKDEDMPNDSNGMQTGDGEEDGESTPQIGDTGNSDIQEKEEQERQEQAAKEAKEDGGSESQEDKDAKEKARADRIKKLLNDDKLGDELKKEAEKAKYKETQDKEQKQAVKFTSSALYRFKTNLNNFISKETARGKERTYSRFNKKYAGTNQIVKGYKRDAGGKIPLIYFYFDRSSSWTDDMTMIGIEAANTLNKFEKEGRIKLVRKCFNDYVFDCPKDIRQLPASSGGTSAGQDILDDIEKNKPDNVVILTDGDIYNCSTSVTVPGGVWLLFKDGVSENLKQHIHGAKSTQYYNV